MEHLYIYSYCFRTTIRGFKPLKDTFVSLVTVFLVLDFNWFLSGGFSAQNPMDEQELWKQRHQFLNNVIMVLSYKNIFLTHFPICNIDNNYMFPNCAAISKANQATIKES